MQGFQGGNFSHTEFLFIGFYGLKDQRWLLFFPFFFMFMLSTAANSIIIFVIKTQRSLHSPMCVLIGAMACVDLSMPTIFLPKMLLGFLLNWDDISLLGCLVQMFLLHFVGSFQSSILLWMALDRYAAICIPLHYNDYMNISNSVKFITATFLRNGILVVITVVLAGNLPYCSSNLIDHCFCEHMALVNLACGSTLINNIFGLVAVFCVINVDCIFIVISYAKIFYSNFIKDSGKSSKKAIHTCTTHIIVICVSYICTIFAYLAYRIKNSLPPNILILISIIHILIPCCCNPIIYGLRTKEIREHIVKLFQSSKFPKTSVKVASVSKI